MAGLHPIMTALDRDNRVSSVEVDLASMASVRAAARQISRTVAHVDALINTAAVYTSEYQETEDGFELMFATNHLGPFLLTNLLRDRLAGKGRVITVAAPSSTRVDMDQLTSRDQFRALRTFGATKAANLMFTFELARRAKRWEVRAYAYHPGLVRSDLMREASRPIRLFSRLVSRRPAVQGGPAHRCAEIHAGARSPARPVDALCGARGARQLGFLTISTPRTSPLHTSFTTPGKDEKHQTSREQRSDGNETRYRFSVGDADGHPARDCRRHRISGGLVGRCGDARVGWSGGGSAVLLLRSALRRVRDLWVPVLPVPAVRAVPHRAVRPRLGIWRMGQRRVRRSPLRRRHPARDR